DVVASFTQRGMETMIVAEAHTSAGFGGGFGDRAKLSGIERAGFFNQHMFTAANGGERDGSKGRVERGDDDRIDAWVGEHGGEIGDGGAARRELSEIGGARGVEIAGVEQWRIGAEG